MTATGWTALAAFTFVMLFQLGVIIAFSRYTDHLWRLINELMRNQK